METRLPRETERQSTIERTFMGYIPENVEWFIAELVIEIIVHGGRSNVVHRNLILVNALSPEEAYEKAIQHGRDDNETDYMNVSGQKVEIRFRGISKLDVVYDPLEDGAELYFEEQLAVSESDILNMIPAKEDLDVFRPPRPSIDRDPDYRSKDVVEQAVKMLRRDESTS